MAAMGAIPPDALADLAAVGELSLDGSIAAGGRRPARRDRRQARGQGLICPDACGPEAAWAAEMAILAAASLIALVNHFKGTPGPGAAQAADREAGAALPDLRTSRARRAPSARWRSPPPAATTC